MLNKNSKNRGVQGMLKSVNLRKTSRDIGFYDNIARKISLNILVEGLLNCALMNKFSLRNAAFQMCQLSGVSQYAKQTLWQRMNEPLLKLLNCIFEKSISQKFGHANKGNYFKGFNRVIIQDSTCVHLPKALVKYFKGSSNGSGCTISTLKIQLYYDLVSSSVVKFSFSSYRDNDQKSSHDIMSITKPGDLVIRDLGYFVVNSFGEMKKAGVDYISRLNLAVNLYDPKTKDPIDLFKKVKTFEHAELNVLMGKEACMPVRLIAQRVPESVANKRRRDLKKQKRYKHSKKHKRLLGWNFFITNLSKEEYPAKYISDSYKLRWHIETLFKAFKQHLNLKNFSHGSYVFISIQIYCKMIVIMLFTALLNFIQEKSKIPISVVKLAEAFSLILSGFFHQSVDVIIQNIIYFCKYETRNRENLIQQLHESY